MSTIGCTDCPARKVHGVPMEGKGKRKRRGGRLTQLPGPVALLDTSRVLNSCQNVPGGSSRGVAEAVQGVLGWLSQFRCQSEGLLQLIYHTSTARVQQEMLDRFAEVRLVLPVPCASHLTPWQTIINQVLWTQHCQGCSKGVHLSLLSTFCTLI